MSKRGKSMLLVLGTVAFPWGLAGLLNGGDPAWYGYTTLSALVTLGIYLYVNRMVPISERPIFSQTNMRLHMIRSTISQLL